jgi:capsular polysaccharide biosynthesis protein
MISATIGGGLSDPDGRSGMERAMTVADVGRALWSAKWVIVGATLVGLITGIVAYTAWPDRYQATSVFTVAPIIAPPLTSSSETVNMDTEAVVATSAAVVGRAASTLGQTPAAVSAALEVAVPRGSEALEFTFTSSSADEAAAGANAVAEAYAENRTQSATAVVDEAKRSLSATIAATQELVAAAPPNSPERITLELQVATLQQRLATLAAATLYPGTLITEAQPPRKPSTPGLLMFVASGVALGALAGVLLGLLLVRGREARTSTTETSRRVTTTRVPGDLE